MGAPLSTYLLASIVLSLVVFLPVHAGRLGAVVRGLQDHLKPPDQEVETLNCWQWGCRTVLALALHLCWFVPWAWYRQSTKRLWCFEDYDEVGYSWLGHECPEPRPYEGIITVALPILGIMLVTIMTLRLLDVSPRRVDPVVYPYLGCAMAFLSVFGCIALYVVLASA